MMVRKFLLRYTHNLKRLQRVDGKWADDTFPDSTARSITAHLKDEAAELYDAVGDYYDPLASLGSPTLAREIRNNVREEAADCLLLLLHLAHRLNFDLYEEAVRKFEKNQQREWETAINDRGYFSHI